MSPSEFRPRARREKSGRRYPLPPALAPLPKDDEGRLSREFLAQDQRDRIVQASLEVIGTKGLAAATVADLIRVAGVSRETFYRYFADKEACFTLLHDEVLGWLEEEAREAVRPASDWGAAVIAVCERLVEVLIADSRLARVAAVEVVLGGPEVMDRHEQAVEAAGAALRQGRTEAAPASDLPDALEPILIAGAVSLVGRRIASGRQATAEPLARDIAELVLIFYLGSEEAVRVVGRSR